MNGNSIFWQQQKICFNIHSSYCSEFYRFMQKSRQLTSNAIYIWLEYLRLNYVTEKSIVHALKTYLGDASLRQNDDQFNTQFAHNSEQQYHVACRVMSWRVQLKSKYELTDKSELSYLWKWWMQNAYTRLIRKDRIQILYMGATSKSYFERNAKAVICRGINNNNNNSKTDIRSMRTQHRRTNRNGNFKRGRNHCGATSIPLSLCDAPCTQRLLRKMTVCGCLRIKINTSSQNKNEREISKKPTLTCIRIDRSSSIFCRVRYDFVAQETPLPRCQYRSDDFELDACVRLRESTAKYSIEWAQTHEHKRDRAHRRQAKKEQLNQVFDGIAH